MHDEETSKSFVEAYSLSEEANLKIRKVIKVKNQINPYSFILNRSKTKSIREEQLETLSLLVNKRYKDELKLFGCGNLLREVIRKRSIWNNSYRQLKSKSPASKTIKCLTKILPKIPDTSPRTNITKSPLRIRRHYIQREEKSQNTSEQKLKHRSRPLFSMPSQSRRQKVDALFEARKQISINTNRIQICFMQYKT